MPTVVVSPVKDEGGEMEVKSARRIRRRAPV